MLLPWRFLLGRSLLSVHWGQSDNVPWIMRGLLVYFSFSTPNPYQMVRIDFPADFRDR